MKGDLQVLWFSILFFVPKIAGLNRKKHALSSLPELKVTEYPSVCV